MHIAILASDWIRKSIEEGNISSTTNITWADDITALCETKADVYIDGLYHGVIHDGEAHNFFLKDIQDKPIWVSSIVKPLADIPFPCIRFNGWNTLFNTKNIEIAASAHFKKHIIEMTNTLQWNYTIVPDVPGLITPKVIAMIINEAYYALDEQVSTKKDIDIAMKLGTNYPYGPFEWAEKIGISQIFGLLQQLSDKGRNERYNIARMLFKEAIPNPI